MTLNLKEHSSSSASSSSLAQSPSSPAAQQPQLPRDPPKIPPPPSEQPPPYTPFAGQTASPLLSEGQQQQQQPSHGHPPTNRRRVVQPPGFRKYLHHLTGRNLLIVSALLLTVLILAYIIHRANQSDEDLFKGKALEEHHRPLKISHKGLGAVKGKRDQISFDESSNEVILSEFDPDQRVILTEVINLDDHFGGFRQLKLDLKQLATAESFDDCMSFTAQLACCSTPSQSHQHLTKCFLQSSEAGQNFTSIASMFDFVPRWQSLNNGEMLVVVHNRQRQAILDTRKNILHQIEEESLPHGYISQGFYFPLENGDELAELIRFGESFRICEYVRAHQVDQEHGTYKVKDKECRQTPFKVEYHELGRLLFCSNPVYTAILQYGHLQGEMAMLTWRIRVKFHSSERMYSAGDSVHARQEQMAMDCDDERVNLYLLGDHELHEFTMDLPAIRNGHFVERATASRETKHP